ncbi:helix-hairpin-helix domain-containing protein [Allobranchiibius sp. CTAmp26]|uniref:helix-hairpin-helix domain-containing protein n=1 Tax=Allobranchiibius sp. CTAmp26 TaxID=2815214 RepID=UPI001AA0FB66|nr:ComEA family DNA-binding protein [Allobranchiibius sp. CTAmp26]MBO1755187.1 ComEA family DNA-binding protein [Allobranchiibius sp. CTAmp26]
MPRVRPEQAAPDRLAAVLDELDAVRRPVGWVPTQESLLDSRRPAIQPAEAGETRGSARLARARGGARHDGSGADVRPHAPLLRTPAALRDAQVAPSRLAVLGVLVVVLVSGLVLGGRVLLARASATSTPVAAQTGARSAATTTAGVSRFGAGSTVPSGVSSTAVATQVVVQVVGQVRRPGVVTLHSGARVEDAVAAAGGALPSADLSAVNLARVVTDGEQIQVPKPGQTMTAPAGAVGGGAGSGGPSGATSGNSAATSAGGVVDLNTADVTGLDALPGVGPVLAQRIIDWRTQNGRFTSVDELGEVSGIGDKVLARLRPHVTV